MPDERTPLQSSDDLSSLRRAARATARGALTTSIFLAGDERAPQYEVELERRAGPARDGTFTYELRLKLDGVLLGERVTRPRLEGVQVIERLPPDVVRENERLLEAFVPDHLAFEPSPVDVRKARPRQPARRRAGVRYNTTIFGTDNRLEFRDTSYPWSAFGRCETNLGPFSGVMIGPRHLLTCNHGIDWTPPPGFAADWLTFTPSYFDGDEPFGSTYATHVYWVKKDDNNGFSNGDEDQYDYVVLVLNDRIGERTGWLGTRRYTDAWDGLAAWWHIGYPQDLSSVERPTFESWFVVNGDDNQPDAHEAIYHMADVFPGQSGGPVFGFWTGDVGPRAVAVQSWQSTTTNGASGGGDLVDLAIRARADHP